MSTICSTLYVGPVKGPPLRGLELSLLSPTCNTHQDAQRTLLLLAPSRPSHHCFVGAEMYVPVGLSARRSCSGKCGQSRPPCNPNLRRPNRTTPRPHRQYFQISQRIRLSQPLFYTSNSTRFKSSSAAAACLDVSLPIDHFPPDCGGNGFRRTTSDFFE